MAACQTLVREIIVENPSSELQKELNDISESIRFSDNSRLSGDEEKIIEKLVALKESFKSGENNDKLQADINDIKALIKIRDIYIKQNQRGKF